MSMYASDYSGGLGAGLGSGLGNLGFGALSEPPLSPPMAQAPSTAPTASFETNGNGNGTGLIAPLTDQPVHGLLSGTAIVVHDSVEGASAPAEETTHDAPSLPFVDLRAFAIDRSAARLIPEQVANINTALPIGFEQGLPLVAIADATETTMQSVRAALGCDARFVLASRTDLVASIAAAYTAPAAGAIRLAMPAGIEPPLVSEVAPLVEETMPTVASIAPIGELELAPVEPAPETEEHAPAEQVELAPIAPLTPIAPVETPVEQPAALEPIAPVEAVAPIEELVAIAEPATVETASVTEADAPVEHLEPAEETVTDEVDEVAKVADTQTETAQELDTAPTTQFRVVIRLSGAEPVEAGAFDAVAEAKDRAFEIVRQLTSEDGSWPYFQGRYLRPDAIVSVDIVEESAR